MGRRKKMWLCLLLWYALVYAECLHTAAQPSNFKPLPLTTRKLSNVYRESENYETSSPAHLTGLSNGETEHFHNKLHKSLPIVVPDHIDGKSRIGYEKDIMLVLPVKPNATATDTELQMWYTQKPITAMVDDRGVAKPEHRADYDIYEDSKVEDDRHPYTNFLTKKISAKPQKTPLDYGYPESFKFVEDLNGLPSNHKPEWAASTDVTDFTSSSSTVPTTKLTTVSNSATRNNPFEMFESVKPLDINKFLSPSMMASMPESEEVTTQVVKNVTESHIHTIPKRPSKQPTKKPQKIKLTTEATTTEFAQVEPSSPSSSQAAAMDPEQVYAAVRYTTLLKQTNKEFLPTFSNKPKPTSMPYSHYQTTTTPANIITTTTEAATTPKYIPTTTTTTTISTTTTTTTTTTAMPTTTTRRYPVFSTTTPRRIPTTTTSAPVTTTTTTTTTSAPATTRPTTTTPAPSSLNDIAVYNVTEDVDDDPLLSELPDTIPPQNLNDFKVQINHFEPPKDVDFFKPDTPTLEPISFQELSPNISSDMLTNDMKNMLVALGIIKSEQISTTSTTEKPYVRKEPVTPNIDANSYTSFKKIPIENKQQDKNAISDDMKDLLASFGLLPKKQAENDTTVNRISRQQNLTQVNLKDLDIRASAPISFANFKTNSSSTVPNWSQSNDDFEADVADFFNNDKPTTKKNKPLETNKPANNKNKPVENNKPMNLNTEMLTDDMKNTLETLGFLKQPSTHNRSSKSAHVFQPTSQLEKLNQDDAAKKITDVLRTIKTLSIKTEANNITADDLEKQLQTITNTLESDSFNDVNETLLLDILSNDANLKLIESIDNMTSKFRPANSTWPVPSPETTTFKIPPKTKTSTESATTTFKNPPKTKTSTESATTTFKTSPKTKTSTESATTTFKTPPKTSTEPATTTVKIIPRNKTSTTTTENVIQTMKPWNTSQFQLEMKPPNPLSSDELLLLYEMGKNEIKRQQPNLTSTSETPDAASSTNTSSIDDDYDTYIPGANAASFSTSTQRQQPNLTSTSKAPNVASSTNTSSNDDDYDTYIPGSNTETFSTSTDQPDNLIKLAIPSTNSTTASTPTSSEINDTKVSANNNAPVNDLADSFGAGGVASEEPTADDLPTPKPNGLYFYLDWNTFLNVGEDDKRPVRIRFSPRAGNPRNFIPITVP